MTTVESLSDMLKESNTDVTVQAIYPGSVPLTQFFNQTLRGDYVAKGVGLNGTGTGIIDLTGQIPVGATVEKAFLYWEVARLTDPVNPSGLLNGSAIPFQLISTVAVNVNATEVVFVDGFRADVTGIANSTVNTLTNFPLGSQGASLVVVYSRNDLPCKTVIINDGIQGFLNDTVATSIQNFNAVGSPPQAKTTYIVGNGESPFIDFAIFNGTTVAGPNAFRSVDGPVWDTLNVNLTGLNLVNFGDTTATASIQTTDDRLFWIAQAFSVTAPSCPARGIKFF